MAKIGVFTLNDRSDARTSHRGNLNKTDAVFRHHDLSRRCSWLVGADIRMVTSISMSGHRPMNVGKTRWAFRKADWMGLRQPLKQHSQRPRGTDR